MNEPKLMRYTFGCKTYAGKLVTIQIPAITREYAAMIARRMMEAAREMIDNLPESLQTSERGESMEMYIYNIEICMDGLDTSGLQEIVDG